uniref:Putative secreted protein n=1 Tax=Anopheles darlingi TaxID=43151 RepID=A0A2M4D5X2_ANODA
MEMQFGIVMSKVCWCVSTLLSGGLMVHCIVQVSVAESVIGAYDTILLEGNRRHRLSRTVINARSLAITAVEVHIGRR